VSAAVRVGVLVPWDLFLRPVRIRGHGRSRMAGPLAGAAGEPQPSRFGAFPGAAGGQGTGHDWGPSLAGQGARCPRPKSRPGGPGVAPSVTAQKR
jgi:hypothetical protein